MDRLLRLLVSVKESKWGEHGGGTDDDGLVERLSRRYTSTLLAVFATMVTTKQFVGEPISCWCPTFFTDSQRQYTNNVCWISNTFYVPLPDRIPDVNDEAWKSRQIVFYYQWVPIILLVMSVMSLLPMLMWRFLSRRSGIDVCALMLSAAARQQAGYAELRERTVRYVVNQIDRYLLTQRQRSNNCCSRQLVTLSRYCCLVGGRRHGNYLTVTYLIAKLAYLANLVSQLFLLEYWLGFDYAGFGVRAVLRALRGYDWHFGDSFPRVTLCAFQIHHQSRVHDYIVQCALTINLFNEKIFVIVWFWLVLVAAITAIDLVSSAASFMYWPTQIKFVRRRLRDFQATVSGGGCDSGGSMTTPHHAKTTMTKFVENYLRRDGLLIIRLIAANVSELAAAETLAGLWENYGPDKRQLGPQAPARRPDHPCTGVKRRRHTSVADNTNANATMQPSRRLAR